MSRTVLIVDDHAAFRLGARALLEAEGFTVVGEADTAAAAVTAARTLRPDVIVLDIRLPDGNAFDLVPELAVATTPTVILVSTHDPADYGPLVECCGAAGFIAKGELSGTTVAALAE